MRNKVVLKKLLSSWYQPVIAVLSRFGQGTFVSEIGELSQLHQFDIWSQECPRTTKCLPSAQACSTLNKIFLNLNLFSWWWRKHCSSKSDLIIVSVSPWLSVHCLGSSQTVPLLIEKLTCRRVTWTPVAPPRPTSPPITMEKTSLKQIVEKENFGWRPDSAKLAGLVARCGS